jgi:hypothetical protein
MDESNSTTVPPRRAVAGFSSPTTTELTAGRRHRFSADPVRPERTHGGRVSFRARLPREDASLDSRFLRTGRERWLDRTVVADGDIAPPLFWIVALAVLGITALATFVTVQENHGANWQYDVDYVLYGLIGLFWIVLPSVLAFGWGKDVPFPTLFRTVSNLESFLDSRRWPYSIGQDLAWIVPYAILALLVILMLHLIFYTFPDRLQL